VVNYVVYDSLGILDRYAQLDTNGFAENNSASI